MPRSRLTLEYEIRPVPDASKRRTLLVTDHDGEPIAVWFDLPESVRKPAARRGRLLCACDREHVGEAIIELRTPTFTSSKKRHELALPGAVRQHITIERAQQPLTGLERWRLVDETSRTTIGALEEQAEIGRLLKNFLAALLPVPTAEPPRHFILTKPDAVIARFEVHDRAVVQVELPCAPEPPLDELVILPLACLLAELER